MSETYDPDQSRLVELADVLRVADEELAKYEKQAIAGGDPDTMFHLREQAERIRRERDTHATEYRNIRRRIANAGLVEVTQVETLIRHIDNKLAVILVKLEDLHQDILNQFEASVREPMQALLERLDAPQSVETRETLQRLETRTDTPEDTALLEAVVQNANALLQQSGTLEPAQEQAVQKLIRVIDDPKAEVKHRLKVSIPIVPFILSYEGEIGLNVGANVRSAYERLKKFLGIEPDNAHP